MPNFHRIIFLIKSKLIYFFLFFICVNPLAKATDTLRIDTIYTFVEVSENVSVYIDSTNKLDFKTIKTKRFEKSTIEKRSIRYTYWTTFYMPQDSGFRYEIGLLYSDSITVFLPQKDGTYKTIIDGILANKKVITKEIERRCNLYIGSDEIDLTRPIFIRYRSLSKWGNGGTPRQLYVLKYTENAPLIYITDENISTTILIIIFLGIAGFLALYFFIQFLLNKRQSYLLYAIYILTLFLYYLNRTEIFHHWLVSVKPIAYVLINEDMQILSGIFYFLFFRSFINSPLKYPRFDKILIGTLIGFFIFILIYNSVIIFDRFNPIHLEMMIIFRIGGSILSLWFMGLMIFNKPTTLEWIALAAALVVSFAMIVPPLLGNLSYAVPFLLAEFLIFAIGLGFQVQQSDEERLKTKGKLIEQLEINAAIQQEMQVKLEAEVKFQTGKAIEKTQEAEQAKALEVKSTFQRELEKIKMKALQAQMNPHFLFNCLNSIRLFYLKNETKKADAYITKFSRLLRLMLNNSRADFISLQEELDSLQLYIEFEQMRFKDKFDFNLSVHQLVNTTDIKVQPLTIQPFVENAIWHGLMQSDEKGKLKIDVHQQEKNIIIAIEDNGIGREKAQALKLGQNQIQHQSFGIRITEERLELMKHSLNKNATFNIFDLKNKENKPIGTRVEIVYEV